LRGAARVLIVSQTHSGMTAAHSSETMSFGANVASSSG